MFSGLRKFWLVNPALLGLVLLLPAPGMAAEALTESTEVIGQVEVQTVTSEAVDAPQLLAQRQVPPGQNPVTSVDDLSDVEPGIWYYDAITNLVNKYQCVAGYPDGTFRPQRSISRAEMAVLLNNCLEAVVINQEDIETIKALQEEFAAELATLRGRVDGLEAQVKTLEAQQFSTTTKLVGEALFLAGGVIDDEDDANPGFDLVSNAGTTPANVGAGSAVPGALVPTTAGDDDRVFLAPRVRLNFDSSFTGTDRLRVRLQAANIPELDGSGCGTDLCRLGADAEDGNVFELNELNYRFKPFKGLTLKASVIGGDFRDDVETFNPLASSGTGALSRFFRFNPVTHRGPGVDSVLSAVYEVSDALEFSVAYGAADPDETTTDGDEIGGGASGLFGGQYGVFAQVGFTPSDNLKFGLQYLFSNFEGSGVNLTASTADAPTNLGGDSTTLQPFGDIDTQAHNFGASVEFQPFDGLIFAGWAGVSLAYAQDGAAAIASPDGLPGLIIPAGADSQITLLNWAAQLIFPDLLAEGNRGSLSVGQAPYIIDGGDLNISDGEDPNFLVEAQYQFKVNKNIRLSPGVIIVINAENTAENGPIFIPVLRTTFSF
jgi:hypothetical protein